MYLILVRGSSDYKKAKDVGKLLLLEWVNEYKHILLNKKCLRQLMNRVQGKNHRIWTYELNKISCFTLMTKFIFLIREFL